MAKNTMRREALRRAKNAPRGTRLAVIRDAATRFRKLMSPRNGISSRRSDYVWMKEELGEDIMRFVQLGDYDMVQTENKAPERRILIGSSWATYKRKDGRRCTSPEAFLQDTLDKSLLAYNATCCKLVSRIQRSCTKMRKRVTKAANRQASPRHVIPEHNEQDRFVDVSDLFVETDVMYRALRAAWMDVIDNDIERTLRREGMA